MKAYVTDPLAILGALHGMNRAVEASDFDHGIPNILRNFTPAPGSLRRLNWGGEDYGGYQGVNSNLSGILGPQAMGIETTNFDTTQRHPLGTVALSRDGRVFRYSTAGGAALVAGNVIQGAAPIANHLALTAVIEAIGAGSIQDPITVTPGATAGAANLYAEGMLCISDGTGVGYAYRIGGHAAITASTAFNLFLDPDDRITVALDATSRYGLHHNPFKNVIIAATTVTAPVVGGAVSVLAANTTAQNYGWLQTRGPFPALINGTPGVGIGVVSSATTAGAVDVAAVAAEINVRIIGRTMQVCVSTKNNLVYLMLD